MQQLLMPNPVSWQPTSLLSACLLLLCENVKPEFETQFTNKIYIRYVIRVREGAVCAEYKPVQLSTIISHISMRPTALHPAQIWRTWLRC